MVTVCKIDLLPEEIPKVFNVKDKGVVLEHIEERVIVRWQVKFYSINVNKWVSDAVTIWIFLALVARREKCENYTNKTCCVSCCHVTQF